MGAVNKGDCFVKVEGQRTWALTVALLLSPWLVVLLFAIIHSTIAVISTILSFSSSLHFILLLFLFPCLLCYINLFPIFSSSFSFPSLTSFHYFFLSFLAHFLYIFCHFLHSLYRYVILVRFLPCQFIMFLLSHTSSIFRVWFLAVDSKSGEGYNDICWWRKLIVLGGWIFSLVLLSSLLQ